MSKTVLSETIQIAPGPQLVPIGRSKIIHAAQSRMETDQIDIWYEIDDVSKNEQHNVQRTVLVVRTGSVLSLEYRHVKTVHAHNGDVFHIYAKGGLW